MTTTELQIAFPKVDTGSGGLVVPAPPETPANAGLAVYAAKPPEQAKKTLVCKDLLVGDTRAQAEQEAEQMLQQMLANTQVFMTFGTDALEGVNSLIKRLLHDVEPEKIPELTELMRDLNAEMRGVKRKYDVSDPKVRDKYEEWKGGLGRFIGRAKTLVELLMEDVTSLERQLNRVGKDLKGRQYKLIRNVSYYDALYEENEAEIGKLIYKIGVMELIRDLAAQAAAAIVVGDASLGDRAGERRGSLTEFVSNMELKIAEYKGRLFIAWATSPQVRTMRTLNVGMAERINELLCVTIPTMEATIVQWRMLMQTQDAAKMSRVVQEASNEWLQSYAAAGAIAVPMIAEAVQTPTLTPQTIAAMADSINEQADGVIKAMEEGARRRDEMEAAIMEAVPVMANASAKVSDALLQRVLGTVNKPLEITTSVPAEASNN
jgi:uncharacterized protein YaaN involved in tellurite resistance